MVGLKDPIGDPHYSVRAKRWLLLKLIRCKNDNRSVKQVTHLQLLDNKHCCLIEKVGSVVSAYTLP